MKKIKITAIALIVAISSSCEGKLDKKYVKDAENNYYQLEWRLGSVYFLNKINMQEIDSIKIK